MIYTRKSTVPFLTGIQHSQELCDFDPPVYANHSLYGSFFGIQSQRIKTDILTTNISEGCSSFLFQKSKRNQLYGFSLGTLQVGEENWNSRASFFNVQFGRDNELNLYVKKFDTSYIGGDLLGLGTLIGVPLDYLLNEGKITESVLDFLLPF